MRPVPMRDPLSDWLKSCRQSGQIPMDISIELRTNFDQGRKLLSEYAKLRGQNIDESPNVASYRDFEYLSGRKVTLYVLNRGEDGA